MNRNSECTHPKMRIAINHDDSMSSSSNLAYGWVGE